MKKKSLLFTLILILIFSIINCKTTANHQIHCDDIELLYNKKLANFGSESENYIFIRLYYPVYTNPFCIENTLKKLIGFVDVHPEKFSHAAIGFDLNDNFIGLTTAGERDLKIEHCTDIKTNPFMAKCDSKKSIQVTYAIKVSPDEYEKAREMVQFFYNEEIMYDVGINLAIGLFEAKRKFFTSYENQKLENIGTAKDVIEDENYIKNKFVCSSFISYILIHSVDSIKTFFEENKLDYNFIIPSDIPSFPGMTKLFKSSWKSYNKAALAYAKSENNIFNKNTKSVEK